jgi:hypothetical protein
MGMRALRRAGVLERLEMKETRIEIVDDGIITVTDREPEKRGPLVLAALPRAAMVTVRTRGGPSPDSGYAGGRLFVTEPPSLPLDPTDWQRDRGESGEVYRAQNGPYRLSVSKGLQGWWYWWIRCDRRIGPEDARGRAKNQGEAERRAIATSLLYMAMGEHLS